MSDDPTDSVTRWNRDLEQDREEAAGLLWGRYFERLVQLAHARLRHAPGGDSEDAALSALHSFCMRAGRGEFPELTNRSELWSLLVTITVRKALDQLEREGRQKRGGGRVHRRTDLIAEGRKGQVDPFAALPSPETSPELAAIVAEESQRLLDALGNDTLRQIALWKMDGLSNEEIAKQLGCTRRIVGYRLDTIRKIWKGSSS